MIHYGRTATGRIQPKNVLERLWAKSTGHSDDECWEYWGKDAQRAGHVRIRKDDKQRVFVHRLAWEAYHAEPIPEGLLVCHRCDNPKCFNPHHLFLGTHKDNTNDMHKKGRAKKFYKISHEQRAEIRQSDLPANILANQYGVTTARIWQIKRGL
jgi:hypothetical protein